MQPFFEEGTASVPKPQRYCKSFAFRLPRTRQEKGPNRCRFGPESNEAAVSEERCRPGRNAARRCVVVRVSARFSWNSPWAFRPIKAPAAAPAAVARSLFVAELLADRAADDGADRRARDAVLVLRSGGHLDFLVPALLGGSRRPCASPAPRSPRLPLRLRRRPRRPAGRGTDSRAPRRPSPRRFRRPDPSTSTCSCESSSDNGGHCARAQGRGSVTSVTAALRRILRGRGGVSDCLQAATAAASHARRGPGRSARYVRRRPTRLEIPGRARAAAGE